MSTSGPLALQQQQLRLAVVSAAAPAPDGLLHTAAGRPALLHIYQQAYVSRLVSALRDNFGVLPRLMGDDDFEALARAYVSAHPSQHPSIRWFGHRLADFMASNEHLVPHPAMVDMARMEWALRAAFDAAAAPPLQGASLAALAPEAWESLVLHFQPALLCVPLAWSIEPAWRALQNADGDDEPELSEPVAYEHLLLVWRPQLETRWRSAASPLEARLLLAAMDGQAFGELCVLAAGELGPGDAPAAVIGALQQWLAEGLLAA